MRKWVLWGHHYFEYQDMFDLPKQPKEKRVLEFACGVTAVNQELTQNNFQVVSCDPGFEADEKKTHQRFLENFDLQIKNIHEHPHRFDLNKYGGLEQLIQKRQEGMQTFFKDYQKGCKEGRYQHLNFKKPLNFENSSFDLVLCANYLFTDLVEQDVDFHVTAIKEMLRLAHDVRIYPLTNYKAQPSQILGPVLLALQLLGYQVSVQEVPFRFVPESKAMLRIQSGRCELT
ncbi:MAG TPA: hypothetical protein DCZ80_00665 [Legionellales bacterium]|nr:hypothetical protein [Legionellales bacterium]